MWSSNVVYVNCISIKVPGCGDEQAQTNQIVMSATVTALAVVKKLLQKYEESATKNLKLRMSEPESYLSRDNFQAFYFFHRDDTINSKD